MSSCSCIPESRERPFTQLMLRPFIESRLEAAKNAEQQADDIHCVANNSSASLPIPALDDEASTPQCHTHLDGWFLKELL